MVNILINININLIEILVVVSAFLVLYKIKKKGDTIKPNFRTGNITFKFNPVIKFLNFNINSKNRNNIEK
jgi:hypothetical protein